MEWYLIVNHDQQLTGTSRVPESTFESSRRRPVLRIDKEQETELSEMQFMPRYLRSHFMLTPLDSPFRDVDPRDEPKPWNVFTLTGRGTKEDESRRYCSYRCTWQCQGTHVCNDVLKCVCRRPTFELAGTHVSRLILPKFGCDHLAGRRSSWWNTPHGESDPQEIIHEGTETKSHHFVYDTSSLLPHRVQEPLRIYSGKTIRW